MLSLESKFEDEKYSIEQASGNKVLKIPFADYPTMMCGDTFSFNSNNIVTPPWDFDLKEEYIRGKQTIRNHGIFKQDWELVRSDSMTNDDAEIGGGISFTIKKLANVGLDVTFIKNTTLKANQYMLIYWFKTDIMSILQGWGKLQVSKQFLDASNMSKNEFYSHFGTHFICGKESTIEILLTMKYTLSSSESKSGLKNLFAKLKCAITNLPSGNINGKKLLTSNNSNMSCTFNDTNAGIDTSSPYYTQLIKAFKSAANGTEGNEMDPSIISECIGKLVEDSKQKGRLQTRYFILKEMEHVPCIKAIFMKSGKKKNNGNDNGNNPIKSTESSIKAVDKPIIKPVNKAVAKPLMSTGANGGGKRNNVSGGDSNANNGDRIYIVKRNDNLSTIVKKEYGKNSWAMVVRLYKRNKDVIGPNMNIIKAGQRLILPKDL